MLNLNKIKKVSVSQGRKDFSDCIKIAKSKTKDVVVQNRGIPVAALISYKDYKFLLSAREKELKQKAFKKMEQIASKLRAKVNLTSKQASNKAVELVKETRQKIYKEQKNRTFAI